MKAKRVFGDATAMRNRDLPTHALFVKWGSFEAGAFGWPAVMTLTIGLGFALALLF
jgi:hypothetical protein